MLKNAYLLTKIGADTAENELTFAEILPIGPLLKASDAEPDRAAGLRSVPRSSSLSHTDPGRSVRAVSKNVFKKLHLDS